MGIFADSFARTGISFDSGSIIGVISWIVGILIFAGVTGGLLWWLLYWKKYNKKIIVFENVSGNGYRITRRDKARLVKIGKGGQEVLYLMKAKVYRTAYGEKMDKNVYWFAIAPDGYWHNVTLKGMTAKEGMILESVHPAMQYQYVALEQVFDKRYEKTTFLQKWGGLMVGIGMIFAVGIIAWLWFKEWSGYIGTAVEVMKQNREIIKELGNLVASMDNICSTSGIRPA